MAVRIVRPKALIVEDDLTLAFFIRKKLERLHCQAQVVDNGAVAAQLALIADYSLIILDVELPEIDGLTILRQMRSRLLKTPVIVITENNQRNRALVSYELGANIFHPKPLDFVLLQAQIKSALQLAQPAAPPPLTSVIDMGELQVEPARQLVNKGGQIINLTAREMSFLAALIEADGGVLSRYDILKLTYRGPRDRGEGSIDTLVSRLRRKLGNIRGRPVIETVHGRGYRLSVRLLTDERVKLPGADLS